jgi:hypothetical protein
MLGGAGAGHAAIRPSFRLDDVGWNATHVLVASEGESIDGTLTVIESWVGTVEPGTELHLSGLEVFAHPYLREIRSWGDARDKGKSVTGRRMIVFLKRDPAGGDAWLPAAQWGGFKVSVCWIESGLAFGLVQIFNPGDAVMVRLGMTEAEMKARVLALRQTKAELARIRDLPTRGERVAAAAEHVDADSWSAMEEAFDILESCGSASVPLVLDVFLREVETRAALLASRLLRKIGDARVVGPCVEELEADLVHWTEAVEDLPPNWWAGQGIDRETYEQYRFRQVRAERILRLLASKASPECADVVRRTREMWRSRSGLREFDKGRIVKACDAALEALAAPPR